MKHIDQHIKGRGVINSREKIWYVLNKAKHLSKIQLAERCGFSPATVTSIFAGLQKDGIIAEVDAVQSDSGRGRKQHLLRLNLEKIAVNCVKIGVEKIEVVLRAFDDTVYFKYQIDTLGCFYAEEILKKINRILKGSLELAPKDMKVLGTAVCIGTGAAQRFQCSELELKEACLETIKDICVVEAEQNLAEAVLRWEKQMEEKDLLILDGKDLTLQICSWQCEEPKRLFLGRLMIESPFGRDTLEIIVRDSGEVDHSKEIETWKSIVHNVAAVFETDKICLKNTPLCKADLEMQIEDRIVWVMQEEQDEQLFLQKLAVREYLRKV